MATAQAPGARADSDGFPADTFERVAHAMNLAYYVWSPGTDEIRISQALRDLFGYDPGTWSAHRHAELTHPDDQPAYRDALAACFTNGADRLDTTYRTRMADGTWRWVRDQASIERDDAGRVTRLVGIVSDITEARQREADLHATIQALGVRDAENRALIAHQAANIEVMKAISDSPDDPQPVFDLIVRHARELTGAQAVNLIEYDGTLMHQRAISGHDPEVAARLVAAFPRPPGPETVPGRVVLSGRIVEIPDLTAEPGIFAPGRGLGTRSFLGVPLQREGRVIGVLGLGRFDTGRFDQSAISLVQSFAEQAVIAIAGATTLRELRARTAELAKRNTEYGERIEQQAATIDVLKAMSTSPGDAQPVFELIAERACAFCEAETTAVALFDGELVHLRSHRGFADPMIVRDYVASFPQPATMATAFGRAILACDAVHIEDMEADPEYGMKGILTEARRSAVAVPMLRAGAPIGAIVITRPWVGRFSETEVELLRTFAEQAVIAIGSAETYRALQERTADLQEALEQQTATAEVLGVINRSPGDLAPVFDAILEKAHALCGVTMGALLTYENEMLQAVATRGYSDETDALARQRRPLQGPQIALARGQRILHYPDGQAFSGELSGFGRHFFELSGARTYINVPLRKDGALVGIITAIRTEVRPFAEKEIALLENFAAQAVIAMENARLLGELRDRTGELAERNAAFSERIDHQAATIEVLKVMSASPGEPQPVLDLIVRRAAEFCAANGGRLVEFDGEFMHLRALVRTDGTEADVDEAIRRRYPAPPDPDAVSDRAILSGAIVHARNPGELHSSMPGLYYGSVVAVPLLREGRAVGAIVLSRAQEGGFTDSQIELLKTFAEQAVIAIASAETYHALQERTAALAQRNSEYGEQIEHQSATIDVLKVMSASPGDTQPVFDQIVRRARELCGGMSVGLFEFDGKLVYPRASAGGDPVALQAFESLFPMEPIRESIACRAILDRQIIHIRDVDVEPGLLQSVRDLGGKTTLSVPLMRDGVAIGALSLNSREPGGFSGSQVELLKTFAEQAVIAITSVANFRALRERTEALARSVAELQALEEVLRAVNSSLDLDTVLETIVSRAVRLSRSDEGTIYEFDATEQVFLPKSAFGMSAERVALLRERRIRLGETHLGRSAVLRAPVFTDDVQQDASVPNAAEALPGIHAVLAVPLLREDSVIGGLVIRRRTEDAFPPATVTLMQTFAGQAVLAIENARLFQELATRGEDARRARVAAEAALADLHRAQDRLVQSEKLASLGQLTAGIAHEIKNPLNFVNNFSDLSVDLLDELHEAVAPDKLEIAPELRAEIDEITTTLKSNLEKIAQHGRRADSIVKNMLLHSRSGPSEHRPIDLNATVEEALNLAYHGARAEKPGFNITMEKDLDPAAGSVDLYPQEFIRVMLNLINNGFYAAHKRASNGADPGFEPTLRLTTRDLGAQVEIRVRDNGTGIPQAEREKIFEPFFTTKPAGEGTGLGLSLSYDIVVKQHNGQLTVDSQPDTFTEFAITLPRQMAAREGGRA